MSAPAPTRLAPGLVEHFYRGGARIAALRGIRTTSDHQPEEWLGATVSRASSEDDDNVVNGLDGRTTVVSPGLARTEGGALLRDLVAADPLGWRGAGPVDGLADSDLGLLLKLLDAGQRLPVHVHPDRAFARSHLGCPYGKTEAWFVLAAEPGATVHLGWTEDVDPAELAHRVEVQDGAWMLARMHRREVRPGDGILVPAGQVHAIGAGVFVAEAQEPTDLSVLLEWSVTTSGPDQAHLDLGMPTALTSASHRALPEEALDALVLPTTPGSRAGVLQPCLPTPAEPFFRLHRAAPRQLAGWADPVAVPAGFAVLLTLSGAGRLHAADGSGPEIGAGEAWVVPAVFGPWAVTGAVDLLVARPGAGWPASLATSADRDRGEA